MKIAICDDEKIFCEKFKAYIGGYYKSLDTFMESFSSGEKLLDQFIKNHNAYDLIFLDIEMIGMDGIRTARLIRELNQDVLIIFLTSHFEFAADGYEVNAFRFLTKPVSEKKLIHALQDVQKALNRNKRLLIKTADKEILLHYWDIVYMEAQNVLIRIRTLNGIYTIRKTLIQMEKEAEGPVFYKPHRSYIINLKYVTDYNNKSITMETGDMIPLSRKKSSDFKKALMMYVKICGS